MAQQDGFTYATMSLSTSTSRQMTHPFLQHPGPKADHQNDITDSKSPVRPLQSAPSIATSLVTDGVTIKHEVKGSEVCVFCSVV